jgi:hypothetical protein
MQAAIVQAAQHRDQQADVYAKDHQRVRMKTAQDSAPLAFNPITDGAARSTRRPGGQLDLPAGLQTIRSEAMDQAERMGLPLDVARDLREEQRGQGLRAHAGAPDRPQGRQPGRPEGGAGFFDGSRTTCPPRPGQGARAARGRPAKGQGAVAGARDQGLDRRHQRAGAGTGRAVQGRRDHADVHDMACSTCARTTRSAAPSRAKATRR